MVTLQGTDYHSLGLRRVHKVRIISLDSGRIRTDPKVDPSATVLSGAIFQSAVLMYTVFPHQVCMVLMPMRLSSGYSRLRSLGSAHPAQMRTEQDRHTRRR